MWKFLLGVFLGTGLGMLIMSLLAINRVGKDLRRLCDAYATGTPAPREIEDWGPPRDELKAESSSFTAKELGTLK